MHIRLLNQISAFDADGVETVTNNYYPVHKCLKKHFEKNDFEKEYYQENVIQKKKEFFCVDDHENAYL